MLYGIMISVHLGAGDFEQSNIDQRILIFDLISKIVDRYSSIRQVLTMQTLSRNPPVS